MTKVRLGNRSISLPGSRIARIVIGVLLVIGGVLGFLPVVGFWMLPLGILVLSIDLAPVRRLRRRVEVWWEKRRRRRNGETEKGRWTARENGS
ncbi:putative membrane protein [Rhodobium orientis]|uniref:Uncharacterized protein n=1 Tax=Rhodobium orientis TaxID=34017 RepID=A0A327JUI2_9HYPH|nr:hypothetical protein [Rhodobium orientis]MBB4302577.1 putative membrane protein [Rhodobium orientis]MBK5949425.1 hypothetical protein [Rhodobium orientis]RAI29144.1 hypothetical protein CH339_04045 [Rhodobium orientis]